MTPTTLDASDLATYAGTWTLDVSRTTVVLKTKAMWVLPVKGTARALEGTCRVGGDGSVEARLVIDAASIDTGMAKRDRHLRTADFFDTQANPTIVFDLTGVRPVPGGPAALEGTLLVHGQSRPVTVLAEVGVEGDTATVVGTLDDLDRRDWGINWAKMGAGVHNHVQVTAVFTRNPPGE